MVTQTLFDRGDIVRACLNPTAGKGIKGDFRPCLVLSPKAFNRLGMTLIAPITQGGSYARIEGFTVTLMDLEIKTQGVVVISGMQMVDLIARKATKVENAPTEIVGEVLAILDAIIAR